MKRVARFILLVGVFGLAVLTAERAHAASCRLDVDSQANTLAFNGSPFTAANEAQLVALFGAPSQSRVVESRARYEEKGYRGGSSTSSMVDYYTPHLVYDDLGLVFRARGSRFKSSTPVYSELLVFYPKPRTFTHSDEPSLKPKRRGQCRVFFNGSELKPGDAPIPKGVDYKTDKFDALGMAFGPTSFSGQIDSLYSLGSKLYVRIFFVSVKRQVPAYLSLKPR